MFDDVRRRYRFTSPRLRGEVGLRSNPGEGVQVSTLFSLADRAPHPNPLPARAGRGSESRPA
ncbi:hypothetical protein FNJ47_42405 [Bradyrhizobium sp. UFLA 03-164]|uniref:Uncharacterized protein n=1 Tax=Bradyrhizobium uaiense TaxID=2594946 RepID=A0A6P1BXD1_9BRAD|nr:hypothetical protein [Bradyrhizobium uaiense]